ncbi:peroxidase 2-like [Oryza brachyantha]|uniref:Peroxidase n=1 Tax=Oryza brachyantha TaxID=4533 RepID=J3M3Q9_ORYBR|nr:peroxidase 2-like [Oryza brachyantha]
MVKTTTAAVAGVLSLCVCVLLAAGVQPAAADAGGYGYGGKKSIEATVREVVEKAIKRRPAVGPALVRLVFHDCWVNGCDGSVLLEKTPYSSSTEKAAVNNIGLDGFDVIDAIKAKLGAAVSCADIVVLAGRDASAILSRGRVTYDVATGRKDGVVSSAAAADAVLPEPTFEFAQLKDNFARKGFTQGELVILSGAHSIGVAHLSSFQDRLNDSTATPIDDQYRAALSADVGRQKMSQNTPNPTEKNNIRDMGAAFQQAAGYDATGVDTSAVGALDNSYYHNNLQNRVLFKSDWVMRTDGDAASDLAEYRDNATKWDVDFSAAMSKLSKLPAEGTHFEIRKSCRCTNQNYY